MKLRIIDWVLLQLGCCELLVWKLIEMNWVREWCCWCELQLEQLSWKRMRNILVMKLYECLGCGLHMNCCKWYGLQNGCWVVLNCFNDNEGDASELHGISMTGGSGVKDVVNLLMQVRIVSCIGGSVALLYMQNFLSWSMNGGGVRILSLYLR